MSTSRVTKPKVEPYLSFDGRCEEALEFYRKALGAEILMLMRFSDSPEKCDPSMMKPGFDKKVMHSSFRIGESTIMATDGGCDSTKLGGFSLSLAVPTEAEADKYFNALAEGGKVQMPLSKTFFSPRFGLVLDRFGVSWMVIVPGQQ
jgi:PhnB protein